jgi:MFS family permease
MNSMTTPPPRRSIYALFAANAISMTGNQLAALAIPWFVLATTGSAAKTGITAFFSILPVVLAAFFGGTLVDRIGFKRMSIIADGASGLTIILIPLLYQANLLEFWVLQVLVFLGALLDAPGTTAREALVPELAAAADMPLERAGSLLQVVERGSRLVGAPLGGVLIALMGPENVMWVNAATFAVSVLLVAGFIPALQGQPDSPHENYRTALLQGLKFIRQDTLILLITVTLFVTNMLDAAKGSVILPVFARDTYDSAVVLGLMFGLSGGGAVVGALLYSAVGHRLSRRWLYVICFVAVSLQSLVLATLPPLPVVLIVQTLTGIAAGPLNPILSTVQFERVPAAMRGRVFGVVTAGAFMGMPLGVLLAGYMLEVTGVQWALVITGGCYLATTLLQVLNPVLGQMERGIQTEKVSPLSASTDAL